MKIYLGADHRGFELKETLKGWLAEQGQTVEDVGNIRIDLQDNFPDFAEAVAASVSQGLGQGIVICGSGGMALVANKFKNIRAVECWNELTAQHAREHDACNVLALPADFIDAVLAKKIVNVWLQTKTLVDEKHQRRLKKITAIEGRNFI